MRNITPIQVIAAIRIGIKDAERRFTRGGCFQLYKVLKELFPEAEAWYDGNHVYTKIEHMFYDINGSHQLRDEFYKLDTETMLMAKAHDWDFK